MLLRYLAEDPGERIDLRDIRVAEKFYRDMEVAPLRHAQVFLVYTKCPEGIQEPSPYRICNRHGDEQSHATHGRIVSWDIEKINLR